MLKTLEQAGFTTEREEVKRRAIVSLSGHEKTGKTHFALSAPDPIALIDMDIGTEGVRHKFDDKEIHYLDFKPPLAKELAETDWMRLTDAFATVLAHTDIRTLIWDTATEGWELLRMARFGKLSQVMPHHYGPVNGEFRRLLRTAYDADVNVILLHKMRAQYVNDKWNGRYERAGFKDMGYIVQVNALTGRDEDGEFFVDILDSRHNPDVAGVRLEGAMCTFDMMLNMVFG